MNTLHIFTDGASRGNPGQAAFAYIIKDQKNQIIAQDNGAIGITTNNDAEYMALLKAWQKIDNLNTSEVILHFYSDSQLMVSQITGKYKINAPHIRAYIEKIKQIQNNYQHVTYQYIPRAQNKETDTLCNLALDSLLEPTRSNPL